MKRIWRCGIVVLMMVVSTVPMLSEEVRADFPGGDWQPDPLNNTEYSDAYIHPNGSHAVKLFATPLNQFNESNQSWGRADTNLYKMGPPPDDYCAETGQYGFEFTRPVPLEYFVSLETPSDTLQLKNTKITLQDLEGYIIEEVSYQEADVVKNADRLILKDDNAFAYEEFDISVDKCTHSFYFDRDALNTSIQYPDEVIINFTMSITFDEVPDLDYYQNFYNNSTAMDPGFNNTTLMDIGPLYVTGNDWIDAWEISAPSIITNDTVYQLTNLSRNVTILGNDLVISYEIPYNETFDTEMWDDFLLPIQINPYECIMATQDTIVTKHSTSQYPNWNYIMVNWASGADVESYVGFQSFTDIMDDCGIDEYSVIDVADFNVYHRNSNAQTDSEWGIYEILNPWTEKINWYSRPTTKMKPVCVETWNGAGQYRRFDSGVTEVVQSWVDGVEESYGFCIRRVANPHNSPWPYLYSSEYSDLAKRPYLYVEWSSMDNRFVDPPRELLTQHFYYFKFYVKQGSTCKVQLTYYDGMDVDNTQPSDFHDEESDPLQGPGLKEWCVKIPKCYYNVRVRLYNSAETTLYDEFWCSIVTTSKMREVDNEWHHQMLIGDEENIDCDSWYDDGGQEIKQYVIDGAANGKDYATMEAQYPKNSYIPWEEYGTGPVIKVQWMIKDFGVDDKATWPEDWNKGRLEVMVEFFDYQYQALEYYNGQSWKPYKYTYIVTGDRGDAEDLYYLDDHSHDWQNTEHRKVMDHISHMNNDDKWDEWYYFDRSVDADYTKMTTDDKWSEVEYMRIWLILRVSGSKNDEWECRWDNLLVAPDVDNYYDEFGDPRDESEHIADSVADFEEVGSNWYRRFEAEDFPTRYYVIDRDVLEGSSNDEYVQTQSRNSYIQYDTYLPAGCYRFYIQLYCGVTANKVKTKVILDETFVGFIETTRKSWTVYCVDAGFIDSGVHTIKILAFDSWPIYWDYVEVRDVGGETYEDVDDDDVDYDDDGIDAYEETRFNGIPGTIDSFLEIDWMEGHAPNSDAIEYAADYFLKKLRCVLRIDVDEVFEGIDQIEITTNLEYQIQRGEDANRNGEIDAGEDTDDDGNPGQPDGELDTGLQWWGRLSTWGSTRVYRYCVYAEDLYDAGDDSHPRGWSAGTVICMREPAFDSWKSEASTLMHELGHEFTLNHHTDSGHETCTIYTPATQKRIKSLSFCKECRDEMDFSEQL